MRVLITGSAGFVGRHFSEHYRRVGAEVVGVDIEADGYSLLDWVHDYAGNHRFDLVIHAAAIVGGRKTIDSSPAHLQAANAQLDGAMIEWCLRNEPGRLVYFSSSAAYPAYLQSGGPSSRMLDEDDIYFPELDAPESSYGWAKLAGEKLCHYAREAGVPISIFRPFSGYGTDQSLDYPFPSFIDRARRRVEVFDIWGTGDQVRDWIHIDDIVGAVSTAVNLELDGPFNLSSGQGITFKQLAAKVIEQVPDYDPIIRTQPNAPAGVAYRVGSNRRMLDFYEPMVPLEQGIAEALSALVSR